MATITFLLEVVSIPLQITKPKKKYQSTTSKKNLNKIKIQKEIKWGKEKNGKKRWSSSPTAAAPSLPLAAAPSPPDLVVVVINVLSVVVVVVVVVSCRVVIVVVVQF